MRHTYPLQWPVGWPRTPAYDRLNGSFKVLYDQTIRELGEELERLGVSDAYLSTDQPLRVNGTPRRDTQPGSQYVALYFTRHGKDLCIPCDKFYTVRDNVRAIMLTLQAIRRMERYGTSQMVEAALTGFTALPASIEMGPGQSRAWHEVLQVSSDADPGVIKAAYRNLSARYHPDNAETGNETEFLAVQKAYKESGA